jgi:hypothetical protein
MSTVIYISLYYALSWAPTNDPSAQASEDSSCPIPRGHCDRQFIYYLSVIRVISPRYSQLILWVHLALSGMCSSNCALNSSEIFNTYWAFQFST